MKTQAELVAEADALGLYLGKIAFTASCATDEERDRIESLVTRAEARYNRRAKAAGRWCSICDYAIDENGQCLCERVSHEGVDMRNCYCPSCNEDRTHTAAQALFQKQQEG